MPEVPFWQYSSDPGVESVAALPRYDSELKDGNRKPPPRTTAMCIARALYLSGDQAAHLIAMALCPRLHAVVITELCTEHGLNAIKSSTLACLAQASPYVTTDFPIGVTAMDTS